MNYAEIVVQQYTNTYEAITRLTSDITHQESLQQWDFDANCVNWLLGHLAVSRLNMLAMLGQAPSIGDMAHIRRYIPGSPSITAASDNIDQLADIVSVLNQTQALLVSVVGSLDETDWLTKQSEGTTFSTMLFYAQHEAFHTGQIELARAMLRKMPVIGFE